MPLHLVHNLYFATALTTSERILFMKDILVTRSSLPPLEEYIEQLKEIWESRWLTNFGEKHELLAQKLKDFLDIENVELYANGHLALEIAIEAMELRGEVITTPFTFISSTNAIVRQGLTPVFCDIDKDRWTIDPEKIESLITDKTSAILAVHVYGIPCAVDAIEKIAKKHKLKVIYDAAHCFACKYRGKELASYGDISMFSFHATKVFHTVEGGALVYSDSGYMDKLKRIRDFGIYPGGSEAFYVGTNAKLSELHAAMGLCNLMHIEEGIKERKLRSEAYDQRLKGIKGIRLFPDIDDLKRNYAYYPVVFTEEYKYSKDEVIKRLAKEHIIPRKYFYPLTSDFSCHKGRYKKDTPIADRVSERVLCLPLYNDLDLAVVEKICDVILG